MPCILDTPVKPQSVANQFIKSVSAVAQFSNTFIFVGTNQTKQADVLLV